ncbi:MAG: LCP family protein [Chloroflexales bacterium]|nr:LCP family protein [Chloroflexales bacterium]
MNCSEARGLIDQGVAPGSRGAAAQLGFHLAGCAACRAYRAAQSDLLTALLANAPQEPQSHYNGLETRGKQAAAVTPTVAHHAGRWRALALAALLAAGMVALTLVLWLGGKGVRTQQNIAAMIVTAAPSAPATTTPTAAAPVATPLPIGAAEPQTTAPASRTARPRAACCTPTVAPALATVAPTATSIACCDPTLAPTLEPPPPGGAVTVLILGSDRRPGEEGVPRTDCVMLARIDPQRGRVALLSFPRDLIVDFPGYGSSRINAAYVWGELYNAPGGGLGLARATVSSLVGVPIDYTVLVDFAGFIGLIDSIGGVTVDVPKELYDARFPTMDYGYTAIHFLPGSQQMDGATALTYSRVRHPDSDFERIKRQQAVLVAIGERLRERGDLQNLLVADQITAALSAHVQMDIPQERVLGLVWALRALDPPRVERYTIDASMVTFGLGDDQYAELAAPGAVEALVQQWYGQ